MTEEEYKGIKCPYCGAVQKYKGGPNTKETGAIRRTKVCECGEKFETIEVLVG